MSRERRLPVHRDARGDLLPVELDEVEFPVRRVFVVTAPPEGADRGGHEVSCGELVVLLTGRAEVRVGERSDDLSETVVLDGPGAGVYLARGEFMTYRLDGSSSILVLAEEAYDDTDRSGERS